MPHSTLLTSYVLEGRRYLYHVLGCLGFGTEIFTRQKLLCCLMMCHCFISRSLILPLVLLITSHRLFPVYRVQVTVLF